MSPPSSPLIAAKYEIVAPLGQGAMGIVYEAENLVTGRRVALKILDVGGGSLAGVGANEGLLREARAAGQLESRHIAQVLDAGSHDGRPYLVLELLRGADLAYVLGCFGRLEPVLALKLVGQACLGLTKAHAAGILHRDIKPANLFLAREDDSVHLKLLDFGLAKAMTPEALGSIGRVSLTTDRGSLVGTPLYMSPEQARSAPSIDGRSDLWSLGVVLYEALTGRTPHEGEASLGGILVALCSKQSRISDHAADLAEDIAALVDRALDLELTGRFQTAEEMSEAIRAIVGSFAIDRRAYESLVPLLRASQPSLRTDRPLDAVVHDGDTLVAAAAATGGADDGAPAGSRDATTAATSVRTLTLASSSQMIIETAVRQGYVLATVRGRMSTADDARTATAFFTAALENAGLRVLLFDARRGEGTNQGHSGLWEWLRAHTSFDRLALVVESSSLLRGFNAEAVECSVNARAFHEVEEAEVWLRAPGDLFERQLE